MKGLNAQFTHDTLESIENCEIFVRAKHCKDPFPALNRRTNELFQLIHTNVWGPFSSESVCNTKFVLTVVEDHSIMIWTYLMNSREHVCSVLKSYILMVATQFGKSVKILRSDNENEFVNKHMEFMQVFWYNSPTIMH